MEWLKDPTTRVLLVVGVIALVVIKVWGDVPTDVQHALLFDLAGLVACIIVFLVLREVLCWYWKINETLTALKDMQAVLRNIDRNIAAGARVPVSDESPGSSVP